MDYFDNNEIGNEALRGLHEMLDRLSDVREDIERAEAELKALKAQEFSLSSELVPEAMEQIGLAELKDAHGRGVSIKSTVFASTAPSKDPLRHQAAMAWLVDHGHAGLIKCTVGAKFPKGDAGEAAALQRKLEEEGYHASLEEAVHPSTLRAWAREMLEQGIDFPHDLFGIEQRNATIIK